MKCRGHQRSPDCYNLYCPACGQTWKAFDPKPECKNMHWIDDKPPIYIHLNDTWLNKTNKKLYTAKSIGWVDEFGSVIDYPKKTRILDDAG